ncbi:MAG: hypothetical protein U0Q16_14210 [Bryobacteraceae bacterium]
MTAALLLLAAAAPDWSYLRSGPLELWFTGDDKPARAALATFDQVRHWTAKTLGRDEVEAAVAGVRIVMLEKPGLYRAGVNASGSVTDTRLGLRQARRFMRQPDAACRMT